jgi:uncharacterized protein (DUF488 family)
VRIHTIGFTKKTAERFFSLLKGSGAKRLVDVRLNNVSQLAGFAKKDDLAYFLREICGMEYAHVPLLAPTQEMLDRFKKLKGRWDAYETEFLSLMRQRAIETNVTREIMDGGCMLCSEDRPEHCHRRLVGEYLRDKWGDVEIVHLV